MIGDAGEVRLLDREDELTRGTEVVSLRPEFTRLRNVIGTDLRLSERDGKALACDRDEGAVVRELYGMPSGVPRV